MSITTTPTIRYVDWFGEGSSEWKQSSIVFTDLDLMLESVLSDHEGNVVFVGQGLGAWLSIRFAHNHPEQSIKVIAISPDGFSEADIYPQTLEELRDEQAEYIGDQWVPTFVLEDWLQWLDNPVKLSIHKEMHLESMLERESSKGNIQFISTEENSHYPTTVWSDCTKEIGWSCTQKLSSMVDQALIEIDL